MLDRLLQIGDRVTITVPKETREWTNTYDFPDGIEVTVCGFIDLITYQGRVGVLGQKPGTYHRRGAPNVLLPNGQIVMINDTWLKFVDNAEYEHRFAKFRKSIEGRENYFWDTYTYLGDLPPTPVWEGDKVRVRSRPMNISGKDTDTYVIIRINYSYLHEKTTKGTKMAAYDISDRLGAGWNTQANEDEIELVERGPVWKFYNNEPIAFSDIKEEANFFEMLGHTEEVRNPANQLFSWTKDEVLEAIRKGLVHGFSVSSGFFGSGPSICAKRFHNEDLGKRVAQATLEGFGMTTA